MKATKRIRQLPKSEEKVVAETVELSRPLRISNSKRIYLYTKGIEIIYPRVIMFHQLIYEELIQIFKMQQIMAAEIRGILKI